MKELGDNNRLTTAELFNGTTALSNIGSIGGRYAGPLNLDNQVCIAAVGKVVDTPRFVDAVQVDGRTLYDVTNAKMMSVNFGCDHRVLDGATVARFSNRWKDLIENPELLIVDMA